MITVGLTGGIGSGKSTVAKMFKALGVPVYDSDTEAKLLMNNSAKIKEQIVSLFGKEAYSDGQLNRAYIANLVFNDRDTLKKLNSIVHPAVRNHFKKWRKRQQTSYVIQESALIFENGMQEQYDYVVLVTAPMEIRKQRVSKRDQVPEKNVQDRMDHQMTDKEKMDLADFLIENIDLETTRNKVGHLHQAFLKLAQSQF